jgi:hypothetical protein
LDPLFMVLAKESGHMATLTCIVLMCHKSFEP